MPAISGEISEHCFGAIFDRAEVENGRISDYRLISYIGTETPPDTGRSHAPYRADAGILVPITPTAAAQMIAQLDAVRYELTSDTKVQRYYYAQRTKLANTIQASLGRIPTNCVDYLVRTARVAGIDLATIDDALRDADQVDDVTDTIDRAMAKKQCNTIHADAFLNGTTPLHYMCNDLHRDTQAVFFRSDENTTILNVLNALPRDKIRGLNDSKPLGQPTYEISRPQPIKLLDPRATLESGLKI